MQRRCENAHILELRQRLGGVATDGGASDTPIDDEGGDQTLLHHPRFADERTVSAAAQTS